LSEEAGDDDRAAELLLEVARRAVAGGALTAAEAAIERCGALAVDDDTRIGVDRLHLDVLSMAGKTELALQLGASLLARQGDAEAAVTHLSLARAAAAATRWPLARDHVAETRRLTLPGSEAAVQADALEATVALTDGKIEEAVALAERALGAGQPRNRDVPEAVCEALEVLGRAARFRDLDAAEERFAGAAEVARAAGLRLWEIRALHELGTIDMLRTMRLDRLEQARQLAWGHGALAIAAVVDLQLASAYVLRFEPEVALHRVERGIEVARLFDLGLTLPMLVLQGATAHAVAGRRAPMEAAIAEAASLGGAHPEGQVSAWGHSRALLALLEEDRRAAGEALREALVWARRPECGVAGAFGGWLAIVATLDSPDGGTVRADVRELRGMGLAINRTLLGYADAIALGQAGHADQATSLVADMDALLRECEGSDGWRHLGHRLVAEAAVKDGWGNAPAWLREALPWFEERGFTRAAAACRELLGLAGAPVPRRGRGASIVPAELLARGVTSREADVLGLVGEGLGNQEIAERLYLSPRTVEKHVERLRDKTAAASRAELAGLAAKYGIGPP
jgi:DNA-binding CsgD family transcriptional regulator